MGTVHYTPAQREMLISRMAFLRGLHNGDKVIRIECGRVSELTVQHAWHSPDPGGFGSQEAHRVKIGYGPGRYNTEVTASSLMPREAHGVGTLLRNPAGVWSDGQNHDELLIGT